MKNFLKSSKNISLFSIIVFVVVVAVLLTSTCYMNYCIMCEEQANTNRNIYTNLGIELADASDFLTSEVRLYSITHDIEHFYNYWIEINETRTRENSIEQFEQSGSPNEETDYLKEAKNYSDRLVVIETYSMQLVLLSEHMTAEYYSYDENLQSYVEYVLSAELPEKYKNLTDDEMAQKAIEILYDNVYSNYKDHIMTPIDTFQTLMNTRLDNEIVLTKNGTDLATILLLAAACFTLIAIAVLLLLFNTKYVKPILKYTKSINNVYAASVKVEPQGAQEMMDFGQAFNKLIDVVYEELNNRKIAEEHMRSAKNEAVIANHAKGIFLASMSHELRLPLNAVNGYTDLLLETHLTEQQESYAKGLRSASDCLLGTINDILDYSKFESGNLVIEHASFELSGVLNEVRYVISNLAENKGLAFSIICDDDIPPVLVGDSFRLRQILVNLSNNAVKFTENGKVTVELKLVKKSDENCTVRFNVSDTGIGIENEALETIFKPFVQTDASVARKYGGTGLGLSICSQIVSGWTGGAGEIQIESKVGKGSVFSFELSFGISDEIIEIDKIIKPVYNGNKVLIVDDNEINVNIEKEMAEKCSLYVITAIGGRQAVEIMKKNDDIELVFMDIRMPELDGFMTSKLIREIPRHKDTPIVALTGDVLQETEAKVKLSGMNGYIKKPVEKKVLYDVIKKYLPNYTEVNQAKESYLETASQYFSPENLLERLGGKTDVFEAVMRMFLDEYRDFPQKLNELKDKNDIANGYEAVHKLKGTSGSICCNRLFEQSDELGTALRSGSFDGIEIFYKAFEKTYFEVKEYYSAFIADKQEDKNGLSRISVIKMLLEYCKAGDFAAVNYFGENISILRRNCKSENFVKIKKAAEQLDFKTMRIYLEKELEENV